MLTENLIGVLLPIAVGVFLILLRNKFVFGFKQFIHETLGITLPSRIEKIIEKSIPLLCLVGGISGVLVGLGNLIQLLIK